jgi:hypothetical protein
LDAKEGSAYARSFNGLARQTGDVDILVPAPPENNRRWIAALSELPDGAAKELFEIADDPFTVRDAGTPSGPTAMPAILTTEEERDVWMRAP